MRNLDKGLYQTTMVGEELINLFDAGNINKDQPAAKNKTTVTFSRDIDLAGVIRDNFGVDICCKFFFGYVTIQWDLI
ncbi:MAG: hypothetical protein Q9198_011079 [Flavoplaca austrocitrina]